MRIRLRGRRPLAPPPATLLATLPATLLAFGALTLSSGGCNTERRETALSADAAPASSTVSADLGQRARDFLLRAAQSDIDVVACNALEALGQVAPDEGRECFRAGLSSPTPMIRYAAARALGEVRDRSAAAALQRLLADPDARVRLAAAYALCRSGASEHAAVLTSALTDAPDEKLRADAAYLIGKLGEKRARARLEAAATRDPSSYVVEHIQMALAMLGDTKMQERLAQYVLKGDTETRLLALQALCETADPKSARALEYRLKDKSDYLQTRLLAARALGRLHSAAGYELAAAALERSGAIDEPSRKLTPLELEQQTMQIRSNAALALGAIGQRRALPALQHLVETESDERTRVAGCLAICQILGRSR